MTQRIAIKVHGLPAPQGSKSARAIYRGKGETREFTGKIAMHESSKKVAPWRAAVEQAAREAIAAHPHFVKFNGPVRVRIDFVFPRLKKHFRTGRFSDVLRDDAPIYHTVYPDADKLQRSTFDALTKAGIWADDARAAIVTASKTYGTSAGAYIEVSEVLP